MRTSLASSVPVLASVLALAACGPGNNNMGDAGNTALSGEGPFLARLGSGERVRTVIVTARQALPQAMEPAGCGMTAWLFDTTRNYERSVVATMDTPDGRCQIYAAMPTIPLEAQAWICAGAVTATYGSRMENLTVCPSLTPIGAAGASLPFASCEGLDAGASVTVASGSEDAMDVVADLNAQVTLPDGVTFTQPTTSALGVLTWPASGNLEVRWTSANATAAVLTLEVRGDTNAHVLVCHPRANGRFDVPRELIQQGNFRAQDVLLRVASYRDARAMAEMNRPYRVFAGFQASLLLQRLR